MEKQRNTLFRSLRARATELTFLPAILDVDKVSSDNLSRAKNTLHFSLCNSSPTRNGYDGYHVINQEAIINE